MATHQRDINAALDTATNELSIALSIPVAWDNVRYNPVDGQPFLRPTLLPAETEAIAISNTAEDEHTGIYQIDIFQPFNAGKKDVIDMADSIADKFKRNTNLAYNSINVRVRNVSIGALRIEGSWASISVEVSYRSFTAAR